MTEGATLGRKGAAQTQLLERYPRLPGITMLLSFACLMGILCLGLPLVILPHGDAPGQHTLQHRDIGDTSNATVITMVLLMIAMEVSYSS